MRAAALWLALWMTAATAWAYDYHESLLQVYAKVLPKILVINQPSEISLEQITICILHEAGDERNAEALKTLMLAQYPNGVGNVALHVDIRTFDAVGSCGDITAVMLLQGNTETIRSVLSHTRGNRLFSAAYDASALREGAIFSLDIETRVRPYLNIGAAKQSRVPINGALLRISRIYQPEARP